VKNAMFTHFPQEPTAYFTPNLYNVSFSCALQNPKSEKQQAENYKNGRERPHFSGFNPPKKFSRSLPPVLEIRQQARCARECASVAPAGRP